MKKLLLFAVVISSVALTSCAKKVDCHCEVINVFGDDTEFEKEFKGTCSELAQEENQKLTNVGTVTECKEH
jgi:hypothetical protein